LFGPRGWGKLYVCMSAGPGNATDALTRPLVTFSRISHDIDD